MKHERFADLNSPAFGPQVAAEVKVEDGDRTVLLSFSSEIPVLRDTPMGPAFEVLGHDPGEVDLSRLNSGSAPVLKDHRRNVDSMVGTVVSAQIEGRRGRALVRLADTIEGNSMLTRVKAGEVQSVSVGYAVHELKPAGEQNGYPVLRATKWEAVEVSLVAVPADPTVGVGRSLSGGSSASIPHIPKGSNMTTPTTETTQYQPAQAAGSVSAERRRASDISIIGRKFNMPAEDIGTAIADGLSVDAFQRSILDSMESDTSTATRSRMGLPAIAAAERSYSLSRVAHAQVTNDWSEAGFELEVSQELKRQIGRSASGTYVPTAALAGRALVTSTTAPSLIGTQQMHDAFVEVLKPQVRVMELGATVLPGLVENVSIPRQTAGCSAEWIAENSEASESSPGFDAVTLTMHQLSAHTRISRRQLKQSLPAVDQILTNDLRAQIAVALDKAAIAGTGVAPQPTGILNLPGIGDVEMGADGDFVTWAKLMELVSTVESANVDPMSLGFLSNLKVKGHLMSTPRISGTDTMMLDPDAAATAEDLRLAGYKVRFSGNVPSDLTKGAGTNLSAVIFGAWADLLIGQWGGIDLIVDDVTEAAKGNVRLVAHSEWDIAARHAESFAAIQDAQTA
ncbi:phage major capsid protein [Sedimentitalea todarodis]|uniref:Phage major capsid protein n=1 Tax=Sedimentitalea todarodis TaxID=1631240 RepID=A0ABU3VBJ6_9RHOB|nr:phage major capsid protein [Sedimentitalea todarodis]MDU9003527.1 phage major capsid protein [Sedimentitalea todarodis]